MESVVKILSQTYFPRNYTEHKNLDSTAEYIIDHFKKAGGKVDVHNFKVDGIEYKNVSCLFGEGGGRRIIIGAHYDAYAHTPGADDNASGVACLIELGYLVGKSQNLGEVELVAYSLEEPPYFATQEMGSAFHARHIASQNIDVTGVIVLEMIGYFSDRPGTQRHPNLLLKGIYPDRGNFIGIVGKLNQRKFTKKVKIGMKGTTELPVYSINAPVLIPGIDFSDHRNYWPYEINAVMITDTAFYRYDGYHTKDDTWDRLDYEKMGNVVLCVYNALRYMRDNPK